MCNKLLNFSSSWTSEYFVVSHIYPTENYMDCDLICLRLAAETAFMVRV